MIQVTPAKRQSQIILNSPHNKLLHNPTKSYAV
jgi:hypothetical protein